MCLYPDCEIEYECCIKTSDPNSEVSLEVKWYEHKNSCLHDMGQKPSHIKGTFPIISILNF
jgi:hypothetical protein